MEIPMEIPTEISFPFLSSAQLTSTPKASVSCYSSSHRPVCNGNYCSSLGKQDLHLCCNYIYTSPAKGSRRAGEEGMRSLLPQKQVALVVHAMGTFRCTLAEST